MNLFSRRRRAPHLGRYKMEKIKRVARTTPHIPDHAPRIPMRADISTRAAPGDAGGSGHRRPEPFAETPLDVSLRRMSATHGDLHDGPVAEHKAPIPGDPEAVANHIKSLAYFLDADMVGICEVPDHGWVSHDLDDNPITPYHDYAVVILIDRGSGTLDGAAGGEGFGDGRRARADLKGSTIACVMADYIRQLGWLARAQTAAGSDVLHTPLTLQAGLGALERTGEVVLNPFLGARFETAVVTTDLPMTTDLPIDPGRGPCARPAPGG